MPLPLPEHNHGGDTKTAAGWYARLPVSSRMAIWQAPLMLLLAWDIGFYLLLFWGGGLLAAQLAGRWQRWYVQLPMLAVLVALAAISVPVKTADFFITLLAGLLPLTWRLQDHPAPSSEMTLSPAGLTPTIFLVGAVFLYQIQFFILLLVMLWLLVFLLWYCMALTGFRLDSLRVRWLPVIGISTVIAALIMVLFIAVPRVSTGFIPGFTPQQQKIALTDNVAPGGMRDLLEDETIAFRAVPQADGQITARYWRVFVLDAEKNGAWQRRQKALMPMPAVTSRAPDDVFALLLDDHDPSTLPAPGWPAGFSPDYDYSPAGELMTTAQANPRRVTVGGSSTPRHGGNLISNANTPISMANPRLVAWARQQRAGLPDDATFADMLMRRFASDFVYDTRITNPADAALDDFFFDNRRGYCSYFATAMATALRAAGIEANVVMGYLGGDWNAYGNFWTIRNADAHAWVEARLDRGGWQRFDPTLVVMSGLAPSAATAPVEPVAPRAKQQDDSAALVVRLRLAGQWVDALNTRLTLAIMDYGQQQDAETGGDNQDRAAFVFIAIAMAMTGVVLAASLAVLSRRRNRQHRPERRLERVLETLDGATPRKAGETMIAYAGRASRGMPPNLQDQIRQMAAMLTRYRHAPHAGISSKAVQLAIGSLKRQVRTGKP